METIVGWRKCFWCMKNVRLSIDTHPKALNICRIWFGNAPENSIAAERRMLPAGMLLFMKGWLYQSLTCEQCRHFWLTWMHVPTVFLVTCIVFSPQRGHLSKSDSRLMIECIDDLSWYCLLQLWCKRVQVSVKSKIMSNDNDLPPSCFLRLVCDEKRWNTL